MAILLREGFGNLTDGTHTAGTTKEILGSQWTSYKANFAIEDRADGRKWLKNDGTARRIQLISPLGSLTSIKFAFRVIRGNGDAHLLFHIMNASDGKVGIIGINAGGQVYYSGSGSFPTSTSAAPLATETHFEVEVDAFTTGETSTVRFYTNGVADGEHTNIRTAESAGPVTNLRLGNDDGSNNGSALADGWKLGDFIVHTGASALGDVGVYYKPVTGDSGTPQFTPSAVGANYLMLDEIGPDEDTTHTESDGTAGHRDSFTNAGVSGLTILSVGALVRARKTDTGSATLLLGAIDGASEDQSSAKGLSEDYSTLVEFFDDAPAGGSWDSAKVTAAKISYEVGA